MSSNCDHCNNIIRPNWVTYKAFDGEYCSNMCRNEKAKIIKIIDPTYNNPVKWQPIIRRTQSCINIDARYVEGPAAIRPLLEPMERHVDIRGEIVAVDADKPRTQYYNYLSMLIFYFLRGDPVNPLNYVL